MVRFFHSLAFVSLLVACGGTVTGGTGGHAGGTGIITGGCVVTGCSSQLCVDEANTGLSSTCEWLDVYACYQKLGICERSAVDGECGWRSTPEMTACVAAEGRMAATGACVRNAGDACESDGDCVAGGCGGELCYNPSASSGASDCDCVAPPATCGCVNGSCAWWTGP